MKELLAPHWFIGGSLSVVGAFAFRLGPRLVNGELVVISQMAGLVGVLVGLFIAMRGVSRAAQARTTDESE